MPDVGSGEIGCDDYRASESHGQTPRENPLAASTRAVAGVPGVDVIVVRFPPVK
jgi:hypothetical protein